MNRVNTKHRPRFQKRLIHVLLPLTGMLFTSVGAWSQSRYVVLIGSNIGGGIHAECDKKLFDYVSTHPNLSGYITLTFNTYAGALEAARSAPCGAFNRIVGTGRETANTYYQTPEFSNIPPNEVVVEHFKAPDVPIADPRNMHFASTAFPIYFSGDYDARVQQACDHWGGVEARYERRLSLTYQTNDTWLCIWERSSPIYQTIQTMIFPACSEPLFTYSFGNGTGPKSGRCLWAGAVDIWMSGPNPIKAGGNACPTGNPIYSSRGAKVERESDYLDASGRLDLQRLYASDVAQGTYGWLLLWHRRALVYKSSAGQVQSVSFTRPDGTNVTFNRTSTTYPWVLAADADVKDKLTIDSLTAPTRIRYQPSANQLIEEYDSNGRLTRLEGADGSVITVTHVVDPGTLQITRIVVADGSGRSLSLEIEPWSQRVLAAVLPDASRVTYTADTVGRLAEVKYANNMRRTYSYNEPAFTSGVNLPYALTGISEDDSTFTLQRLGTYKYDTQGRAVSTEHTGGVNKYSISYVTPYQQAVVTDPLGTQRTRNFTSVLGVIKQASTSQPAGAGSGPCSDAMTYDTQGNISSRTDFDGHKTCYAYNLTRNLETKRVEGLSSSTACSTALTSPPVGDTTRVITTDWHPDWRLETRRAEPKRITTWVYNGYGAVCAPADALVDGKPIAVVCSKTEQATTDDTGALGFSGAASGSARTWTYTYNRWGQMLTSNGPRSDVVDTTIYEYYPDTQPNWMMGDLKQTTNAAGHVTRFTQYNRHGQVLQRVDANGLITNYTYDLRQRLTSITTGDEQTRYDYDAVGNLKKVTLPDGGFIAYTYDAAHRLIQVDDHKGNKVAYTLDAMGNRIAEKATDPSGALVRNLSRVVDALNRVQQVVGE